MNTKTQTEIKFSEDLALSLPIVGYGRIINRPTFMNGWYLVPLEQDKSSIPKIANEIVEQYNQWDLEIQGFLFAHDKKPEWWPVETTSPSQAEEPGQLETEKCLGQKILEDIGSFLAVALPVIGTLFVFGFLAALGSCNDPVLIVVIDEEVELNGKTYQGVWYECHRWLD